MIDLPFTITYSKKFWLFDESDEDNEDTQFPLVISSNNRNFMLLKRESASMVKMLEEISSNKLSLNNLTKKEGWFGKCEFCGFENNLFIHSGKNLVLVSCYNCFTMITTKPNIILDINKQNIKGYYNKSQFIYLIICDEITQYQIVPTITLWSNKVMRHDHCQICFFNHNILDVTTCRICYKCKNFIAMFKKFIVLKFLILSDILNADIAFEVSVRSINILYNTHLFIKDITLK